MNEGLKPRWKYTSNDSAFGIDLDSISSHSVYIQKITYTAYTCGRYLQRSFLITFFQVLLRSGYALKGGGSTNWNILSRKGKKVSPLRNSKAPCGANYSNYLNSQFSKWQTIPSNYGQFLQITVRTPWACHPWSLALAPVTKSVQTFSNALTWWCTG